MAVWWYLWVFAVSFQGLAASSALVLSIFELHILSVKCQDISSSDPDHLEACSKSEFTKTNLYLGSMIPFSLMAGVAGFLGVWASLLKILRCLRLKCLDLSQVPAYHVTRLLVLESALSGSAFLYGLYPLLLGMMLSQRSGKVIFVSVVLVGLMPIVLSTAMGGFLTLHHLRLMQEDLLDRGRFRQGIKSAIMCATSYGGVYDNTEGIDGNAIATTISPAKSVDGYHPIPVIDTEPDPDSSPWFPHSSSPMMPSRTHPMLAESSMKSTKTSLQVCVKEASL